MIDREKLKKAFECCLKDEIDCLDCPYSKDSFSDCQQKLRDGVMELMKQEPMMVLSQQEWLNKRKGFCPKCHQTVEWYLNRSYCGFCGQEVKWDD